MDNTLLPDNVLIRAIGNWNPKIFKPKWILKNLLGENAGVLNFLVNPEVLDIGYDIQGIKMFPKSNELMIVLDGDKQVTEENVLRLASLFLKIYNLLPHTPIEAIGFNVTFTIKNGVKTKVTEWLTSQQKKFEDLSLTQMQVSKKCDKYTLNILATEQGDSHKININYHFENNIVNDANYFLGLYKDAARYI